MTIISVYEGISYFIQPLLECDELDDKQKEMLLRSSYKLHIHGKGNVFYGKYTYMDEYDIPLVTLRSGIRGYVLEDSLNISNINSNYSLIKKFWSGFDVYRQNKIKEGIEPLEKFYIPQLIEKIKNKSYYCEIEKNDYKSYIDYIFYDKNFEIIFRYEYYYLKEETIITNSGNLYSFHENIKIQPTPEEIARKEAELAAIREKELIEFQKDIEEYRKRNLNKKPAKKKGWFF